MTQLLILILYLKDLDSSDEYNRKHLMVEYIITGNPQREERYDYPLDAIREIVLNMIVHRDYRDSSDSVIKIFDDRIEFFNPGDLYDDLTIEQLESNNYESKTRNKLIALMFKECGLIEKYGSGISRIKKFCLEHDIVEPEFKEMQKGFKVTLYKQKRSENSDVGINVGINELFKFIAENQPVRVSLMKEEFDTITTRTIERWIKQLKDEEKIEYRGSKKTGGYFVKEDEE